jgi:hypothetical protein
LSSEADAAATPEVQTVYKPLRRRLPDERASMTRARATVLMFGQDESVTAWPDSSWTAER